MQPKTRDYFAEMYVAALLGDDGWNVYFPRRDNGFDMIATKAVGGKVVLRPIQVKGLYPTAPKKNKTTYGYRGRLSQVHPDMILALVFFDTDTTTPSPRHVAWMPRATVRGTGSKGAYRCVPATYKNMQASPRRDFSQYFDAGGLRLLTNIGA